MGKRLQMLTKILQCYLKSIKLCLKSYYQSISKLLKTIKVELSAINQPSKANENYLESKIFITANAN